MSLFTIADLHLSLSGSKPMDIFPGWENHASRLRENWQKTVGREDTVVIPGDISWGMSLEEALPDFRFIDSLNGKKIILKGNHDYWWSTKSKADRVLRENEISSIEILNNNFYSYGDIGICGTRGWINDGSEPADAKVRKREAMRLERSILLCKEAGLYPAVFLHYPPVYGSLVNSEMLEVMLRYDISLCFYGHLHGQEAHKYAPKKRFGINFWLVSSDYLQFKPLDISLIVQSAKK